MKVDIEKVANIYFEKLLVELIENDCYFNIHDDIKCQMVIEGVTFFQKKYTNNRFPFGHNMRRYTNDILDFHIHFNYKGTEHRMNITLYPKLIYRKLKINKLLGHETDNKRNQ